MTWLEPKLYETPENQATWGEQEWMDVWAQICHVINNCLITVTQEKIDACDDFTERHMMERHLPKKIFAENQVRSWDVSKMSHEIKAIIKADLMQRRCLHSFLRRFENLEPLNNVERLEKTLYLNSHGIQPLNWFQNMNIYM